MSQAQLPSNNDPLGEALHQLRLNGSLYCRSQLGGAWALAMPQMPNQMMFHIITRGQCWIETENKPARILPEGAIVLMPHGRGHNICSAPNLKPTPFMQAGAKRISERYEILELSAASADSSHQVTELTCGVMSFDQNTGAKLIQQLPELLILEQHDQQTQTWVDASLGLINAEAKQLKPGGETIITHLADILIIQLIRHWMETAEEANSGWLGALKDKQVGQALALIHQRPEYHWTVESLAQSCGMSRSGFSARFSQLVGSSVKNYLTQWRMQLAYQRLKHENLPLIELAESLGYASEAAFSRAFKRVIGMAPSRI